MLVCGIILIDFLLNVLFKNSINICMIWYVLIMILLKINIKKKKYIIIDNVIWNFNVWFVDLFDFDVYFVIWDF